MMGFLCFSPWRRWGILASSIALCARSEPEAAYRETSASSSSCSNLEMTRWSNLIKASNLLQTKIFKVKNNDVLGTIGITLLPRTQQKWVHGKLICYMRLREWDRPTSTPVKLGTVLRHISSSQLLSFNEWSRWPRSVSSRAVCVGMALLPQQWTSEQWANRGVKHATRGIKTQTWWTPHIHHQIQWMYHTLDNNSLSASFKNWHVCTQYWSQSRDLFAVICS